MKGFIEYLLEHDIISKLRENYNIKEKNLEKILNTIVQKLPEINEINENIDLIGNIYENILGVKKRKILGEFYTPFSVVNYILNAVGYKSVSNIENKNIIDISCGSGSFIIQVVKRLTQRYYKLHKINSIQDLTVQNAKNAIDLIEKNIKGIDINPIACVLCQINIQFAVFKLYNIIKGEEEKYVLPFFNIQCKNALSLNCFEKYDFVVGNPPYLFIRDIPEEQKQLIDKGDFETNVGQYDYYQIFIELGIKRLRDNGYFGYIIPDSLLALSNRRIVRKFIYENTKINELYHIGPQFEDPVVSNIIIILQKELNESVRENNLINIKRAITKDMKQKIIVQKNLLKWNFNFLINLDETDITILNLLNEKFPKLSNLMKNRDFKIILSRGVELGKDGEVIFCKKCEKYLPLPKNRAICSQCNEKLDENSIEKIIYDKKPENIEDTFQLYIYSINRYLVKKYKYINTNKKGINYKPSDIYKERIIIRQMSQNNKICATYDPNLSLTSQSMYNLKIVDSPVKEFSNFYLLGLINSSLMSYFFMKSFGSYKRLFPRILIEKIKGFPILVPETDQQKELALELSELTRQLLSKKKDTYNNEVSLQKRNNALVFDLYQIPKSERQQITNL